MALTEIQLKICSFHDLLSQKGSRSLAYSITHSAAPIKVPPGADRPHPAPFSYATGLATAGLNTVRFTWQAAANAVALLSAVENVVLEKNVQGVWRAGLNWSAGWMRPAGRSLATRDVDYEKKRLQHTPLSESNTNGERLWFNSPDTDTNLWSGIKWLDGQ